MRGITHLAVGIAGAICLVRVLGVQDIEAAACVVAGGLGGLVPDIDHPKALISKYAIGIGGAVRIVVSHRGATHTLAFVALMVAAFILGRAPITLAAAFVLGMVLHLAADMLTTDGVRLLRPLSGRAWRLLPYSLLWFAAPAIEQLTMCVAIILPVLMIART